MLFLLSTLYKAELRAASLKGQAGRLLQERTCHRGLPTAHSPSCQQSRTNNPSPPPCITCCCRPALPGGPAALCRSLQRAAAAGLPHERCCRPRAWRLRCCPQDAQGGQLPLVQPAGWESGWGEGRLADRGPAALLTNRGLQGGGGSSSKLFVSCCLQVTLFWTNWAGIKDPSPVTRLVAWLALFACPSSNRSSSTGADN